MTVATLTHESLLEVTTARCEADQLPYFDVLSPQEAVVLLAADSQARLVDVRTHTELDWIGMPDISSGQFVHVEWNQYPSGARNINLLSTLETTVPKDAPALFLCYSAVYSKHVATAVVQAGHAAAMDMLEGPEGAKDTRGHRKTMEG